MKKERGITLVSLIIYVVVMTLILVVLTLVINRFYQNTDGLQANTEQILQFSKLNTYFLKEVKMQGNDVDTVQFFMKPYYIVFKTGNSFSYQNDIIYYNNMEICDNVKQFSVQQNEDVLQVTVGFENFTQTMNYKLEEIY